MTGGGGSSGLTFNCGCEAVSAGEVTIAEEEEVGKARGSDCCKFRSIKWSVRTLLQSLSDIVTTSGPGKNSHSIQ